MPYDACPVRRECHYAADLLMPWYLFRPLVRTLPKLNFRAEGSQDRSVRAHHRRTSSYTAHAGAQLTDQRGVLAALRPQEVFLVRPDTGAVLLREVLKDGNDVFVPVGATPPDPVAIAPRVPVGSPANSSRARPNSKGQ